MTEDKQKESEKLKEVKKVKVLYSGTGAWTLDFGNDGRHVLGPGDTQEFNLSNKRHLHQLMQILKTINTDDGKINTQEYIVKGSSERTRYRKKFEIISGKNLLPKLLQNLEYRHNKAYTDEEKEAIVSLCPTYFIKEEKLYKIGR